MAINYLLYSANKEPFVETVRKVHEMEDRDYNVGKPAGISFIILLPCPATGNNTCR